MVLSRRKKVCVVGDSITEADWASILCRRLFGGTERGVNNTASWPIIINSGRGGDKLADVTVATRVTNYAPDYVITFIGVNDVAVTATGTFQTQADTYLGAVISGGVPAANNLVIGILARGENWPDGANANDTALTDLNTAWQTVCTSRSVQFYNPRSAFFTWEAANNPGHLSSGLLTTDGIHLITTSKDVGQWWFANTLVSSGTITAT